MGMAGVHALLLWKIVAPRPASNTRFQGTLDCIARQVIRTIWETSFQ